MKIFILLMFFAINVLAKVDAKKDNFCEVDADCVFYVDSCGDLFLINNSRVPKHSQKRSIDKTDFFAHDNKNPPLCPKDFIRQPDVPVNRQLNCEDKQCVIGPKS